MRVGKDGEGRRDGERKAPDTPVPRVSESWWSEAVAPPLPKGQGVGLLNRSRIDGSLTRVRRLSVRVRIPPGVLLTLCRTGVVFSSVSFLFDSLPGCGEQDGARPSRQALRVQLRGFFDDRVLSGRERNTKVVVLPVRRFFSWSWHGDILAKIIPEVQLPT